MISYKTTTKSKKIHQTSYCGVVVLFLRIIWEVEDIEGEKDLFPPSTCSHFKGEEMSFDICSDGCHKSETKTEKMMIFLLMNFMTRNICPFSRLLNNPESHDWV
jgi:hypothetical protein